MNKLDTPPYCMTLKSITPICLYDPHHLLLTNLLPLANNDTAAVIKFNLNASMVYFKVYHERKA